MVTHYEMNTPQVAGEIIDHEAVIINLATGHYFSLEGVAADIWYAIERHSTLPTIVNALVIKYSEQPQPKLEAHTKAFIQLLLDEGLVRSVEGEDSGTISLSETAAQKYSVPVLKKFTDMEDLILLDPIHEVDELGWPNVKSD